jgi:hypothetical protein
MRLLIMKNAQSPHIFRIERGAAIRNSLNVVNPGLVLAGDGCPADDALIIVAAQDLTS